MEGGLLVLWMLVPELQACVTGAGVEAPGCLCIGV